MGEGYPPLSDEGIAVVVTATEALARERLGGRSFEWTERAVAELRASTASLFAAAEALHRYELLNSDEPAFALELGDEEG